MSKKHLIDGAQVHVIPIFACSDGYVLWAEHVE